MSAASAIDSAEANSQFQRLADGLLTALDERASYRSPWPAMPQSVATFSELESEYLLANEGRLGIVLLRLADGDDAFARGAEAIDKLRALIAQTAARHPETQIGLTGLPVMENDEMRASRESMLRATLLSMIGVACLFVAGFGGVRHPLMTVAALLLAMAWSLGYLTLAVGHLNILSVAFGVILIGLGIDFGIHYVARYLEVRADHAVSCEQALHKTATGAGPGIVTGAVTTAIAFFTAGFTEFTGVAELGVIAGGGILLCGVAMLVALPAMIYLCDQRRQTRPTVGGDGGLSDFPRPLNVGGLLAPLFKRRRATWVLAASLLLTAGLGYGMVFLRYDHNLLNLQAKGLDSVHWERKLLDESDQNVWFALSIAESREELLQRKQKFLELDSVSRVEEIASLLPGDHDEKRPLIKGIHDRLAELPERPPHISVDSPETLGRLLARVQGMLAANAPGTEANPAAARTQRRLEQIRDILRRTPVETCVARLGAFQQQMAGDLLSRLYTLRDIANPEPPKLDDLPESLVTRFVGKSDHFLLKIYGRGDIWDMDTLSGFVHDVRAVDSRATGNPLQAYEASLQMKLSYQQAAIYALLAIAAVLIVDLRNIGETLLAVAPLGLGMVQMFGLLGWLGLPLNPANMIVLPLILGIGVDDGVHVVHDFHAQRSRFRLSSSTATAVLLTSLTSMVGIGSLMTANHQGLQSLGRVLTLGVTCCLFTSLITLPALLTLLTRSRRPTPDRVVPKPHFSTADHVTLEVASSRQEALSTWINNFD